MRRDEAAVLNDVAAATTTTTTPPPRRQSRSISALTLDETEFHHHHEHHHEEDDNLTLRAVADDACKRVVIGTAIMPEPLFATEGGGARGAGENDGNDDDNEYARIVESEFNAVVIEHHLKWSPLCVSEPGPFPDGTPSDRLGRYDFHHVDRLVDWAVARDLRVKGHVLVWHVTSPLTLLQQYNDDPEGLRTALKRHVFTTMAHFRGRIRDWDVVNEALAPDGSLAENLFYQVLGPSYIADCFRWAHEADPTARLFYNDNKVEGYGDAKSDALYNLVADLQAQGVPIHGVGLQGHFKASGTGRSAVPTPRAVKQQIKRIGALGLAVHLSEVDVRVGTLADEEEDDDHDARRRRDAAQTQIYHDLLAAALSEPACEAVYLWGFTDKHTWIADFYNEAEDETPLLWDTRYRRKPAYYAVRQALQSLTPRGRVGGEGVLLDTDTDVEGNPWGHGWRRPSSTAADSSEKTASGDDRPDWLQSPPTPIVDTTTKTTTAVQSQRDEEEDKKPEWLQDTTTPPSRGGGGGKPAPDALFKLREDEAERDVVDQNHRTMSSMELLHHDGRLGGVDEESHDDDDDDAELQSGYGLTSGDDDELQSGDEVSGDEIDQSGDDMTQPMENLRDDIPEIS